MILRSLIIRSEAIRTLAATAVLNLPINAEHPVEILFRPYKKAATDEQRAIMWIRIGEIADQAYVQNKQFSGAAWHEKFKRDFLPEAYTEGITRDGYVKWIDTPGGERTMVGSTEMLTAKGKAQHTTQIEAAGAAMGVHFSADREA